MYTNGIRFDFRNIISGTNANNRSKRFGTEFQEIWEERAEIATYIKVSHIGVLHLRKN